MLVYSYMFSRIVITKFFWITFSTQRTLYLPFIHRLVMKFDFFTTNYTFVFCSQSIFSLFNLYKKHSGINNTWKIMLNITLFVLNLGSFLTNVNLLQDFYLVGLLPFEFKINCLLVFLIPEFHLLRV